MLMETPPSPSKPIPRGTAFEIRNRFSKPRTYLLEWPLSARRRRYRIGCRRSRGDPPHADSVTNQILQASANFQNLSQSRYPLLLHNSSLLVLTHSTLPIQIRALVVFQIIVNPSSTHRRTLTNSPA